jgi:hypothetical protein
MKTQLHFSFFGWKIAFHLDSPNDVLDYYVIEELAMNLGVRSGSRRHHAVGLHYQQA